jgi:hypothetical protein
MIREDDRVDRNKADSGKKAELDATKKGDAFEAQHCGWCP